jgi:hypothetical protein
MTFRSRTVSTSSHSVTYAARLPQPSQYCESGLCNHSAVMDADLLPDETPMRSLYGSTVVHGGLAPMFDRIGHRTGISCTFEPDMRSKLIRSWEISPERNRPRNP